MSKNKHSKAISSVAKDNSTNWAMWKSTLSPSSEVSAFSDKEKNFDYNILEKSGCKSQSTAKLENTLPEKPPNFVPFQRQAPNFAPFQSQGLISSYQPKNNLNSGTSDDFSAVPEEFRPIINSNNNSGNDFKLISNKHNNTSRNLQKNAPQSINIKETMPKGIIWKDNFKTNGSKVNQAFTENVRNFKLHNTKEIGQQKTYDDRNVYKNEQYQRNIPTTSSKNKLSRQVSQDTNCANSKSSTIKESTKEAKNPSMTILSQTTSFRVVTPERDVETRKTVQKLWTTNASEELATNENKSGDVLFEFITRKSERKKMTWLENLCTVELSGDENNLDYVHKSSNRCPNFRQQNKAPRPRKNMNFPARNPNFNRNEEIPNEAPHSRNNFSFSDHAEGFIRGQYRFESERGRQKQERINVPNRHSKGEEHVMKNIVEVVHVNKKTRRKCRNRRSNRKDNSKYTSKECEYETSNENSDLASATARQTAVKRVQSNANQTQNINENDITLHQSSSNDQNYLPIANIKSKIHCVEGRECVCEMNSRSNGTDMQSQELSVRCETRFESSPKVTNREDVLRQKSVLINYGEEISDSIVGSYTAINMFLSFYNEWKNTRVKAIQLLENIAGNISSTTVQRRKTRGVFEMLGNGGRAVSVIPDARAALVGRLVTALSDFFAKLFSSSPTLKQSGMDEFELMLCLQQDIDATSDMNIYGIQCDQNFQETCNIVEDFHNAIQGWCFEDHVEGQDAEFLKDISTMNPKRHRVYYRRLYTWLQRLVETPSTDISRAFTRGFKDFPDAVDTTNLLHWRFHAQEVDQTVSLRSWEEIRGLLQNGNLVTVEDILKKIQNSILVLIKERSVMEKHVMELLDAGVKLD